MKRNKAFIASNIFIFMKKVFIFGPIVLILVFILGGQSGVGAQTVTGSIGNGTISRGAAARGVVVIDIPGGLHVNSSHPNSQYAIATSVRVSGKDVKTGAVRYPAGHNRKFSFSEVPINVYQGRTSFPFTVTVPANFRGSVIKVRAVVKYQACTEEVCYPPKTKEITLTAKVR
ncbi:MAG: protein-disulfide reductase DsbD domain-containing protein [Pyrinomonadaceae bacterium]